MMLRDDGRDPQPPVVVVGRGEAETVSSSLGSVPGITSEDALPVTTTNGQRAVTGPAVTVVATDLADPLPDDWRAQLPRADGLTLAVITAPESDDRLDARTARDAQWLRRTVDATVVVEPGFHDPGFRDVVTTVHEVIARPGVINLDLADMRTVLGSGAVAAITTGEVPESDDVASAAVDAVDAATSAPAVDIGDYTAVLVNLVASDQLTVSSAVDAVDGIQTALPDDAHLIWGTAVDDSLSGVQAQVVASGDSSPTFDTLVDAASRPDPGPNNCPRCGGHIAVYTLGDSETRSCDDCGFADTPGVGWGQ